MLANFSVVEFCYQFVTLGSKAGWRWTRKVRNYFSRIFWDIYFVQDAEQELD